MHITHQFKKSKASFLSKISHELKSPIHGIMSLSDYLNNNWNNIDEQIKKKCVSEIAKSSLSLNMLIDSLFNIAKFSDYQIKFKLEPVNLRNLITSAVETVGIFIANNDRLKISLNYNTEITSIKADAIWFKQLLTNILINSIKFSKEGEIKIEVSEENISGKKYVKFAISDEGIGIPESELKQVFQEFNTGSRNFEDVISNGLGLAICEEIIKAHNGMISAHNNPQKGVTVEFSIPQNDPK